MVCFTKILCVGLSILALAASDNPQESRTRRHLTLNGGRESVLRGTNEVKKSALEEVRELNSRILKGSKGYYGKGKGGYYAKSSKGPKGSKGGYGKGKGSGYYMYKRQQRRKRRMQKNNMMSSDDKKKRGGSDGKPLSIFDLRGIPQGGDGNMMMMKGKRQLQTREEQSGADIYLETEAFEDRELVVDKTSAIDETDMDEQDRELQDKASQVEEHQEASGVTKSKAWQWWYQNA